MALEDLTGTKFIDSLNSSNPTATDGVSEGDDHIRGIKNVLKTTFPNVSGAVTSTHTELNLLDGATVALASVTSTAAELNILDGVTSTAAELNELDASAAAVTDYVHGVRTYVYSGNTEGGLDVAAVIAIGGVDETVGPTGSGATNIWTAMDALPSTTKAIIIGIEYKITSALAATYDSYIRAYKNGVTATDRDRVARISLVATGASQIATTHSEAVVALDSNLVFKIGDTDATSAPTSREIDIFLRGFIV